MAILIVGASGKTGRLLVNTLLDKGKKVKVIVRSLENLSTKALQDKNLILIKANILQMSDFEIKTFLEDCTSIVSCLGHNMTLKGIYGKPRRLVTDVVSKLSKIINENNLNKPIKFILMNTSGNINHELFEKISFLEKCVMSMIRLLIPPHVDNEEAANFLRLQIGQKHKNIQWVAVRPDALIDEEEIIEYEVYSSPIRSAIFDSGKTSRINVASFISELICEDNLWDRWKGQMPVVYNKAQ